MYVQSSQPLPLWQKFRGPWLGLGSPPTLSSTFGPSSILRQTRTPLLRSLPNPSSHRHGRIWALPPSYLTRPPDVYVSMLRPFRGNPPCATPISRSTFENPPLNSPVSNPLDVRIHSPSTTLIPPPTPSTENVPPHPHPTVPHFSSPNPLEFPPSTNLQNIQNPLSTFPPTTLTSPPTLSNKHMPPQPTPTVPQFNSPPNLLEPHNPTTIQNIDQPHTLNPSLIPTSSTPPIPAQTPSIPHFEDKVQSSRVGNDTTRPNTTTRPTREHKKPH